MPLECFKVALSSYAQNISTYLLSGLYTPLIAAFSTGPVIEELLCIPQEKNQHVACYVKYYNLLLAEKCIISHQCADFSNTMDHFSIKYNITGYCIIIPHLNVFNSIIRFNQDD